MYITVHILPFFNFIDYQLHLNKIGIFIGITVQCDRQCLDFEAWSILQHRFAR